MILEVAVLGAGTLMWARTQAPPSPLPGQQAQVQVPPQQYRSVPQASALRIGRGSGGGTSREDGGSHSGESRRG